MGKRLLILGGTGEAAALAQAIGKTAQLAESQLANSQLANSQLAESQLANSQLANSQLANSQLAELEVLVSLAGRTQQPKQDSTRIGGFGGVEGLIDYLQTNAIDFLIDATHPFAAQISHHAHTATTALAIPHLILLRPEWTKTAADNWLEVTSNATAAATLRELGRNNLADRVFLTIGRQELSVYADLQDQWFLMRMIDPPLENTAQPPGQILLDRGPFDLVGERSLLQKYHIDVVVSKNSGGEATYGKIIAARELRLPVIMVQRPPLPKGIQAHSIAGAIDWIEQQLSQPPL